jgi:hypothetical protein
MIRPSLLSKMRPAMLSLLLDDPFARFATLKNNYHYLTEWIIHIIYFEYIFLLKYKY